MMRVIPVEMAIKNDAHKGTYEEIHQIVDNAWEIAVTDCSCRRTRRLMGEGCGHLEKDVCIFFNEGAEYHIRTGHGPQDRPRRVLRDTQALRGERPRPRDIEPRRAERRGQHAI